MAVDNALVYQGNGIFTQPGAGVGVTIPKALMFSLDESVARAAADALDVVGAIDAQPGRAAVPPQVRGNLAMFVGLASTRTEMAAPLRKAASVAASHKKGYSSLAKRLAALSDRNRAMSFHDVWVEADRLLAAPSADVRALFAGALRELVRSYPDAGSSRHVRAFLKAPSPDTYDVAWTETHALVRDEAFARSIVAARRTYPGQNITAVMGLMHAGRTSLLVGEALAKSASTSRVAQAAKP